MVPAAKALAGAHRPVLVPVPLARSRRRERGFNQSEVLAASISATLDWPLRPLLVRREGRDTLARLGRRERTKAVADAFEMAPGAWQQREAGATLLVDDVVTTGATAAACYETITAAGIACVGVVSFGRTDPLGDGR